MSIDLIWQYIIKITTIKGVNSNDTFFCYIGFCWQSIGSRLRLVNITRRRDKHLESALRIPIDKLATWTKDFPHLNFY